MRQVKFLQDWKFNVTGGQNGKRTVKAGHVGSYSDDIAEMLVHTEHEGKTVAQYHDMRPQETKVEQNSVYQLVEKGAGWYAIVDADGDEVDKIRGKQKAENKLEELNDG